MPDQTREELPFLLLRAGSRLVDGIQEGMVRRGFDDVRPAHGFAFALFAQGGATAGELAGHLGVTKQAAAQMVDDLERKGYVARTAHPRDSRARVVVLTEQGLACTRAAEDSAAEVLGPWLDDLGVRRSSALAHDLALFAREGRLRPTW